MLGEHHGLLHEFPDYRERIHELKMSDAHFHNLMEQYDEVNKKVEHLEQKGEPVADETLEELKKQRLHLKDEIYHRLTEGEQA
jgi:hypothetical protein